MNTICPHCKSIVYEKNLMRHMKTNKCQKYQENLRLTKNSTISTLIAKNAELTLQVDILTMQLHYTEQLFAKLAKQLNNTSVFLKASDRQDKGCQTNIIYSINL